jgi:hypothetical protein
MSSNSPPNKKFKKTSSEVSTSKTSNFLNDIEAERKKVSLTCDYIFINI